MKNMKKTTRLISLFFVMFFFAQTVFAEKTASSEGEPFNPTPYILHHIADSYEWHLWGNVSIPLPVILYTDGALDVFMSSEFQHGKA